MKYYIIAGERSGDLHGSNLIKALKEQDSKAEVRCFGGDQMQAAGGDLAFHYKHVAFMMSWEVVKNLRKILSYMRMCKKDIIAYAPDVLILIDYGGFNMKMAAFAKKKNIKVHYYISPKIWAWNTKRAWKIKENVDEMFVILPFEEEFYKQFGYQVNYVGNPLLDAKRSFIPNPNFKSDHNIQEKPIIAVLPGSRKQEIEHMLGLMVELTNNFKGYQFIVAGVDNIPADYYAVALNRGVKVVKGATYDLLNHAYAAIVTSGTATLETALFEVPQVVCYKMSALSYRVAKMVAKVEFISLVNLIAGKEVVPELIQNQYNKQTLLQNLDKLVNNEEYREFQFSGYNLIKKKLGDYKVSDRTASLIIEDIKKTN